MVRAVLLAALLLLLGLLFRELVTLLVALLITVLVSIPLAAAATKLEARGVPRPAGAFLGLVAMIGSLAAIVAAILPSFVDQADQFIDDVPGIVDDLEREVGNITGAEPEEVGDQVEEYVLDLGDRPERLIDPLADIGLGIAGVLAAAVFGLIIAYYIAVRPEPLVRGALALVAPPRREWARGVGDRIREAWIGWMKGVAFDMVINGLMIYLGLMLVGLDFALVFGVLAGLLTVVPYFGPIAASIPPILFALTDSVEMAILVAVVYLVVQQIEGNLTIPLVMSQTVQLHPALIAIGVLVVGQLFGIIGLFVAVPILSLIVILVDELWVKPRDARYEPEVATANPGEGVTS